MEAGAAKDLDRLFHYTLLAILGLFSLMHLFAFVINWEARFFGMKMDGMDAGIILFAYFLVPAILAFLLFRYPRKISIIALLSIFFFGFSFIDSSTTVQVLSNGQNSFTGFMAAMVVIPLIVLIGHLIVARLYDSEGYFKECELERRKISELPDIDEEDKALLKRILLLLVAGIIVMVLFGIIVLLFGPVVIIPGIILLLLLLILLAVKRRYDAKKSGREIEGEITGEDRRFMIIIFAVMYILLFSMIAAFFLLINR